MGGPSSKVYIYTNVLGRVPRVRNAIRALTGFRSRWLRKAQKSAKGAKGLKKALEKAVRACPVPPVRSKRLFEPASVPPVRSKRLFETAVRDHYSKVLGSATLCSEATVLCSALLRACICTGPH